MFSIALSLLAIHERNRIHGDLSCANVGLVNVDKWEAKEDMTENYDKACVTVIIDFESSQSVLDDTPVRMLRPGTRIAAANTAPETATKGLISKKSDGYALGAIGAALLMKEEFVWNPPPASSSKADSATNSTSNRDSDEVDAQKAKPKKETALRNAFELFFKENQARMPAGTRQLCRIILRMLLRNPNKRGSVQKFVADRAFAQLRKQATPEQLNPASAPPIEEDDTIVPFPESVVIAPPLYLPNVADKKSATKKKKKKAPLDELPGRIATEPVAARRKFQQAADLVRERIDEVGESMADEGIIDAYRSFSEKPDDVLSRACWLLELLMTRRNAKQRGVLVKFRKSRADVLRTLKQLMPKELDLRPLHECFAPVADKVTELWHRDQARDRTKKREHGDDGQGGSPPEDQSAPSNANRRHREDPKATESDVSRGLERDNQDWDSEATEIDTDSRRAKMMSAYNYEEQNDQAQMNEIDGDSKRAEVKSEEEEQDEEAEQEEEEEEEDDDEEEQKEEDEEEQKEEDEEEEEEEEEEEHSGRKHGKEARDSEATVIDVYKKLHVKSKQKEDEDEGDEDSEDGVFEATDDDDREQVQDAIEENDQSEVNPRFRRKAMAAVAENKVANQAGHLKATKQGAAPNKPSDQTQQSGGNGEQKIVRLQFELAKATALQVAAAEKIARLTAQLQAEGQARQFAVQNESSKGSINQPAAAGELPKRAVKHK